VTDIRFLGHACFELSDGDTRVLVDPFLSGNPKAAVEASELEPSAILLTHGHADHLGDTVDIAKRANCPVVAIVELANEIGSNGVEQVFDPNIGGTVKFDWGWVKLTPAWHTAVTPSGTPHTPAGLLIGIGGQTIYHLGDTALFSDLKLVAHRGNAIDVAIVPIGGHYTMDRLDAVEAVKFVEPKVVIPCHYDTFPPIETDAQAFKSEVESETSAKVEILEPGGTYSG
jgi:L-ascorbate metabolism protein UlaG (beta-lactamase superfamily)